MPGVAHSPDLEQFRGDQELGVQEVRQAQLVSAVLP